MAHKPDVAHGATFSGSPGYLHSLLQNLGPWAPVDIAVSSGRARKG